MNTYVFAGIRLDYPSTQPFSKLITAFESIVPYGDPNSLVQLARTKGTADQITQSLQAMVGTIGVMYMVKIDQGTLLSLITQPKKMTLYILGNPLIANQMYDIRRECGVYAPLRALIYEDQSGVAHITYDQPSSLLQQFQDTVITNIGLMLDNKMDSLAKFVVA
jgi:uncharacterized protein (DUF302 family)